MDFFGHRQVQAKQKLIALASPAPRMIADAVRDQTLPDGYSASEPLDDSGRTQRHDRTEIEAWEDVSLEHADEMGKQHADSNLGGAILQAPVTPASMEIPSSPTNIQLMYLYMVSVQNFRRWLMIPWLLQRAQLREQMVTRIRWQKLKFVTTTSLR